MYVGEEGLEPPVSKRADLQSARLPITGYPPKTFECFNHSCYMYNIDTIAKNSFFYIKEKRLNFLFSAVFILYIINNIIGCPLYENG